MVPATHHDMTTMSVLTTPLKQHHHHCDDLFAIAEAEAAAGCWPAAAKHLGAFASELKEHFSTEEELLFPAFENQNGMRHGPTMMMRLEHAQMRELVEQMQAALTATNGDAFAGAAETLLIMMQQHNIKEENILYPMCDQSLAAQIDSLGAQIQDRLAPAANA